MRHNLRLMPFKDPQKHKECIARYYLENKERLYLSKKKKRSSYRKYLQEVKEATPCADCKENFPYYIMDFDHLPGTEKKFEIGGANSATSLQALKDEIAKCEVVCANCHRHRTFMRQTQDLTAKLPA